jgi:hypothetical protein
VRLETWLAVINPVKAFQGFLATGKLAAGAAGIGLFFAFWSWVGFDVVFHVPGDDQARFLELYGSQILPRIRSTWG